MQTVIKEVNEEIDGFKIFESEYARLSERTDKILMGVMLAQWGIAMALSLFSALFHSTVGNNPLASQLHASVLLGGLITVLPVAGSILRPGRTSTRYVLVSGQILWSVLIIHLSGGRIEAHFHVLGSLALIAFYCDIKLLLYATFLVLLDHFVRDIYWPQFVDGVADLEWWRFAEHAGWVLFVDGFLIMGSLGGRNTLLRFCHRQAHMESIQEMMRARTREYEFQVEERMATMQLIMSELAEVQTQVEIERQRLFDILEHMPHGVFVLDANHKPLFANEASQEILGKRIAQQEEYDSLSEEFQVYVKGTNEIYPEAWLPAVQALQGRHAHCDDIEIQRSDRRVPLSVTASPIRDGNGAVVGAVAVFEDVSEREKLQNDLLQAQKLESIGQLAAGIAHEINTPMQYIGDNIHFLGKGFANISCMLSFYEEIFDEKLLEGELRDEIHAKARSLKLDFLKKKIPRSIDSVAEGVQAVSKIVRAMKDFSHPGMDEKTPTDINHAIQTTITIARSEWKYIAELETDFDAELPMVPCFPGELNQVVLNMVVNAAHAIEETSQKSDGTKGKIMLKTRTKGNWAEITIRDTGAGIPRTILDKIFDPFFTTKEVGKGTGQGLAIARSIITELHGGEIKVDSKEGQGTTFRLLLPMDESYAREAA